MIKDTNEKFRAKHANYVDGMITLNDREFRDVDQTHGPVFRCAEVRCIEQKQHCHRKRPFLIYDRIRHESETRT